MRLETKQYIHLDDADKHGLITAARGIDQTLSADEYIDYIETVISRAVDLLELNEDKQ